MSYRRQNWVNSLRGLSAIEYRVLMRLACFANADTLLAWPAVATLVEECECSERSVHAALAAFRRRYLIEVARPATRSQPVTYRLCVPVQDLQVNSAFGCNPRPVGVQKTTDTGAPFADEPITEPCIEQTTTTPSARASRAPVVVSQSARQAIPDTWEPDTATRELAVALLGDRAALVLANFHDHFRLEPETTETDWQLKARIWVRKERPVERRKPSEPKGAGARAARAPAVDVADPGGVGAAYAAWEADGGIPAWTLEGYRDVFNCSGLPVSWHGDLRPLFEASLGRDYGQVMTVVAEANGRFDGPTSSFARYVPAIEAQVERLDGWRRLLPGRAGEEARVA